MKLSHFTLLTSCLLLLATPAYTQGRNASIRSVDFKNFTYPLPVDLRSPGGSSTVTLEDGRLTATESEAEMHLGRIVYGDVTADGAEEAMVYLGIRSGGSAMPGVVYVYTLRRRGPSLLWSFSTGDRADGGLHRIYAERGGLVVELYGPQERWEGDGQPMRYTRRRYVWVGRRFRQKGRKEVTPLSMQPDNGMRPTADTLLVRFQSWCGAVGDTGL